MSGTYPWSVLGIAPTSEGAEIRRAYARRLRTVRPDEDPAAFQALVEARDLALNLAKQVPPQEPSAAPERRTEPVRSAAIVTTVSFSFEAQPPAPPPSPAPPPPVQQAQSPNPAPTPAPAPSQPPAPNQRTLAPRPQPRLPAPPPASPQSVVEAAQVMFQTARLEAWPEVLRQIGELPQSGRSAVETRLLAMVAKYAKDKRSELSRARRVREQEAFFELLAALNAEFGWRERDRVIYASLGTVDADNFVSLLDRARRDSWPEPTPSGPAGYLGWDRDEEGLTPNQRRDRYHFFDQNNDLEGLGVCRKLLADPEFRRRRDAMSLLFSLSWPQRWRDLPGLLAAMFGWAALLSTLGHAYFWVAPFPILYFLLRDVHFSDPPRARPWSRIHRSLWLLVQLAFLDWVIALAATLANGAPEWRRWLYFPFLFIFAYWVYAAARLFAGTTKNRREDHPAWDRKSFLLFPFVAFARRYYAQAVAGMVVWLAVMEHQAWEGIRFLAFAFPNGSLGVFGCLILLLLAATLHLCAGYNSGRWLVLRFFAVSRKADRKRIFHPDRRASFLLENGTRKKNQKRQQSSSRRVSWWWIVLFFWFLGHLLKALSMK
jgi:hypothetical protein